MPTINVQAQKSALFYCKPYEAASELGYNRALAWLYEEIVRDICDHIRLLIDDDEIRAEFYRRSQQRPLDARSLDDYLEEQLGKDGDTPRHCKLVNHAVAYRREEWADWATKPLFEELNAWLAQPKDKREAAAAVQEDIQEEPQEETEEAVQDDTQDLTQDSEPAD